MKKGNGRKNVGHFWFYVQLFHNEKNQRSQFCLAPGRERRSRLRNPSLGPPPSDLGPSTLLWRRAFARATFCVPQARLESGCWLALLGALHAQGALARDKAQGQTEAKGQSATRGHSTAKCKQNMAGHEPLPAAPHPRAARRTTCCLVAAAALSMCDPAFGFAVNCAAPALLAPRAHVRAAIMSARQAAPLYLRMESHNSRTGIFRYRVTFCALISAAPPLAFLSCRLALVLTSRPPCACSDTSLALVGSLGENVLARVQGFLEKFSWDSVDQSWRTQTITIARDDEEIEHELEAKAIQDGNTYASQMMCMQSMFTKKHLVEYQLHEHLEGHLSFTSLYSELCATGEGSLPYCENLKEASLLELDPLSEGGLPVPVPVRVHMDLGSEGANFLQEHLEGVPDLVSEPEPAAAAPATRAERKVLDAKGVQQKLREPTLLGSWSQTLSNVIEAGNRDVAGVGDLELLGEEPQGAREGSACAPVAARTDGH
jgi:hypothetical protein